MAEISTEGWINSFQAFIKRQELPLSDCSPNLLTNPVENSKSASPLTKATEIINTNTEQYPPELVTLAFKIIYLKTRNDKELIETIRKHERYIVQLSSRHTPTTSRHELSTLGQVLSGTKQFGLLTWSQIINLDINSLPYPTAIVASYYFFILQGILQDVSTNLHAVTKSQSGLDLLFLWDVARLFLSKSQFSRCLENGDDAMRDKYSKNKTKILCGFIKVLKYLLQKKDGHKFASILQAFELKLSEMLGLPSIKTLDLSNEHTSHKLELFIKDYEKSLRLMSAHNASDCDLSVEFVAINDVCDTKSFETEHLQKTEHFLRRLNQNSVSQELVADIIDLIQSSRANEDTFDRLLQTLVPPLLKLFNKAQFVDQMKKIARICFEYGNAASSGIGLRLSIELDILSYAFTSNARDLNRVRKRIEFSIWTILSLKEGPVPKDLFQSYFEAVMDVQIDDSFSRMAAEGLAQDHKTCSIFFGKKLRLSSQQQSLLLESISPILANRLPSESYYIMSDLYKALKDEVSLPCIYKLVYFFKIEVDVTAYTTKRSSDYLLLAAIKTEYLNSQISSKLQLQQICRYYNQWIDSVSSKWVNRDEEILLRVVNKLFQTGFYNLCIECTKKSRKFEKCITSKTNLELELLLCEATIRSGGAASTPELLRMAGLRLKEIALENNKGILPLNVVRWKLLQLYYYLKSNDYQKLATKLQETGNLILTAEEFKIDAKLSCISLSDKLLCLLVLARYHLFVSQYEFSRFNFAKAIRHANFSIKLTKSVLRKSDSLLDEFLGLSQTVLSEGLRIGYMNYRHVGLAKEAKTFLLDLSKINKIAAKVKLSYGHFDLANSLFYLGERSKACGEFEEGSIISAAADFETLDVCMTMAAAAIEPDLCGDNGILVSTKVKQFREKANQSEARAFEALSVTDVDDLFVLLNLNVTSKALAECALTADFAKTNRQVMLTKALYVVKGEVKNILETSKARFYLEDVFNSRVSPTVTETLYARLMENKNCLQKMIELEYFAHLDNSQQREVSHLFRICSIISSSLSPEATSNRDLSLLVHLEEAPRKAPYEYHKLIAQELKETTPELTLGDEVPSSILSSQDILEQVQSCLPENWGVVSLDICSITGDLIITRLRTKEPIALIANVPMPSNIDFQDIVCELTDIISRSNLSTKDSVTLLVKTKEDRKNWWRHRFELDLQLQDLLCKIERILSGVSGVFDAFEPECYDLRRFSQDLDEIFVLTFKELPPNWSLDVNISELFFSLKGKDDEEESLEALTSLVFDQFKGKFQFEKGSLKLARAIEKIKSLTAKPLRMSDTHTILITSDVCSLVPWESLGLLRKKSVTRMPNLTCTLSLLKKYQDMRIKRSKSYDISYVINPGKDLKRTESTFKPVFNDLPGAIGITGEAPTELILEDLIHNSNLFVFMGHGGGEQYMRMSTIMKSQKADRALPPALLMGCSSCAFQENGNLPMSSNIFDWLVHGSPAVVANLWDVTDKDIDLFTLSMLESWGVTLADNEGGSLNLAVAESRERCILKFLNGSAPIVYGLPLNYK